MSLTQEQITDLWRRAPVKSGVMEDPEDPAYMLITVVIDNDDFQQWFSITKCFAEFANVESADLAKDSRPETIFYARSREEIDSSWSEWH